MPKIGSSGVVNVKDLQPLDRFLYWCRERHSIYSKRKKGLPAPWTTDPVLQKYFFTNPYRENDKVTEWFRTKVRGPMAEVPEVVFATVAFRWFNFIPTGEILLKHGLLTQWNEKLCIEALQDEVKIFTGAYMISSPKGESKLKGICSRITYVWDTIDQLQDALSGSSTLQEAHGFLQKIDGLGGFMAYEIVCDLRYTSILRDATDVMTWCNPGPGAIRGIYRMLGMPLPSGNSSILPVPDTWEQETQKLLTIANQKLRPMPPFEMREVEHSLCEWDKYERLLWGDGRAKRLFHPPTVESPSKQKLPPLRRPQIAILRTLIESGRTMTRKEIAELSGVDQSKVGDYAGPRPDNQTEKTKTRWPFPTLMDLGYIAAPKYDCDGSDMFLYSLTKKGLSFATER